jgi:hypothetical protein
MVERVYLVLLTEGPLTCLVPEPKLENIEQWKMGSGMQFYVFICWYAVLCSIPILISLLLFVIAIARLFLEDSHLLLYSLSRIYTFVSIYP